MPSILNQRCFNHAAREAVGQCQGCQSFFCRECLVEHDERMICTVCLRTQAKPPLTRRSLFLGVVRWGQVMMGLLMLWTSFYLVGRSLLMLPTSVHEGTLWQEPWFGEDE